MDDLFLKRGNIDAAMSNKFKEGIEHANIDDEPDEESLLEQVADHLNFDSANAIDDSWIICTKNYYTE